MDSKELGDNVAEFLIDRTNAVDGDGQRFAFGRTYYYFDGQKVCSVQARYHCLALDFHGTELHYRHVNNRNDFDLDIATKDLFSVQQSVYPSALLRIEEEKRRALRILKADVSRRLKEFSEWGEEVSAIEHMLRESLSSLP